MEVRGPCSSMTIAGARVAAFAALDADLTGARLTDVRLVEARMADVSLAGAVIENADLSGAVLRNVDLTGLRIEGARLHGVTINGLPLGTILAQAGRDAAAIARLEIDVADLKARIEALEQNP